MLNHTNSSIFCSAMLFQFQLNIVFLNLILQIIFFYMNRLFILFMCGISCGFFFLNEINEHMVHLFHNWFLLHTIHLFHYSNSFSLHDQILFIWCTLFTLGQNVQFQWCVVRCFWKFLNGNRMWGEKTTGSHWFGVVCDFSLRDEPRRLCDWHKQTRRVSDVFRVTGCVCVCGRDFHGVGSSG